MKLLMKITYCFDIRFEERKANNLNEIDLFDIDHKDFNELLQEIKILKYDFNEYLCKVQTVISTVNSALNTNDNKNIMDSVVNGL